MKIEFKCGENTVRDYVSICDSDVCRYKISIGAECAPIPLFVGDNWQDIPEDIMDSKVFCNARVIGKTLEVMI